ncbi:uncharacterized protein BXZ73DRAFT_103451 [Epithele typhae]|uniref:uncharacterized protein n=1 Tax=Epithele typhae TaxID=378194 RepID=UPI00200737C3|nr:uncharacterized protein BXZ73DRAFT_103451 [Epithele typhae]KAH9924611.1 hypothetical protein BXZ73DRAFT_103451 [Epithele typhae]
MTSGRRLLASLLLGTTSLWLPSALADSTTCVSTELDWYTDHVGETPCTTYQRLRQICNIDYQVEKFNTNTPGDTCNDQLDAAVIRSPDATSCQYDAVGQTSGIDAGIGAYGVYLGSCASQAVNQSLPTDIQSAVCNKEIKIDRNLYSLFWVDGPWFYAFTKGTMTKDFAASNNNTFTKCASTTNNGTTSSSSTESSTESSTSSTSSTATSANPSGTSASSTSPKSSTHQKRAAGPRPLDLGHEYEDGHEDPPMSVVTPFSSTLHPVRLLILLVEPEFALPRIARADSMSLGSRGVPGPAFADDAAAAQSPSHYLQSVYAPTDGSGYDEERHVDASVALARSGSGRLPPAYRSWEEPQRRCPWAH